MALNVVPREKWYARMPSYVPDLPTPVSMVFCNYTRKNYHKGKKSPGPNPNHEQIIDELIYLQRGDLHKYADIRYNFMVCPDGNIYMGRGWTAVSTLPLKLVDFTFKSIYIGFIGDFKDHSPPRRMFDAREEILKYGVENGYLTKKILLYNFHPPEHYRLPFEAYL